MPRQARSVKGVQTQRHVASKRWPGQQGLGRKSREKGRSQVKTGSQRQKDTFNGDGPNPTGSAMRPLSARAQGSKLSHRTFFV